MSLRRILPDARRPVRRAAAAAPRPEVVARIGVAWHRRSCITHQAAAIDRLRTGTSVVVATGTASGKSLCYQLPIVDVGRSRAPRHRAARSTPPRHSPRISCASLRSWLVPGLRAVTYDGDTDRRRPHVGAQERERRAHQSRDAAHGHPAVAQAVGDVPHATAIRRDRRAAHAPRHLRQPRRARAAPAAAAVRALRRAPDVLLRECDDRQPRPSWPRALCGLAGHERSTTTVHHTPSTCSRAGNGRCSTSHSGPARRPTSRPPNC